VCPVCPHLEQQQHGQSAGSQVLPTAAQAWTFEVAQQSGLHPSLGDTNANSSVRATSLEEKPRSKEFGELAEAGDAVWGVS
jgi:hypothetical protein